VSKIKNKNRLRGRKSFSEISSQNVLLENIILCIRPKLSKSAQNSLELGMIFFFI
jgi:hypothetical protein